MTNNKQQTAVEWYIDELEKYEKGTSEYFSIPAIQNHARRMEKERIIKAWKAGDGKYDKVADKLSEQYYEQTFGGNQ
jgi:hypothetical protein